MGLTRRSGRRALPEARRHGQTMQGWRGSGEVAWVSVPQSHAVYSQV